MKKLKRLSETSFEDVYRLMKLQSFPHMPTSLNEAISALKKSHVYGVIEKEQLIAAVLFFETDKGVFCVDAVCHPKFHSRWATGRIICGLLSAVYEGLGANVMWTEYSNPIAQQMTEKLGFKKICMTKHGTLCVLTEDMIDKKWKEKKYGFNF